MIYRVRHFDVNHAALGIEKIAEMRADIFSSTRVINMPLFYKWIIFEYIAVLQLRLLLHLLCWFSCFVDVNSAQG